MTDDSSFPAVSLDAINTGTDRLIADVTGDGGEWLADYREAQTAGHHVDCDGWRTAHRVIIKRDRSMLQAVCEECGPLHPGMFGPAADCLGLYAAHEQSVRCDGRCKAWS